MGEIMTVLQRNTSTRVDLTKLGRVLAAAAVVAAFAAGAVYGVDITAAPGETQTQAEQAQAADLAD
jgi:hypothetical protein